MSKEKSNKESLRKATQQYEDFAIFYEIMHSEIIENGHLEPKNKSVIENES